MNMKKLLLTFIAIAACSAATASPPSDKSLNRWMEVQHIERDFLKKFDQHDGSTKPTTHATGHRLISTGTSAAITSCVRPLYKQNDYSLFHTAT